MRYLCADRGLYSNLGSLETTSVCLRFSDASGILRGYYSQVVRIAGYGRGHGL